jgi:hypothetical protein
MASEDTKASKLSDSYIKELEEVIELSDIHKERLTEWEHNFLSSISARLEQYGASTFLSDKQLEVIEKISKKIYAIG